MIFVTFKQLYGKYSIRKNFQQAFILYAVNVLQIPFALFTSIFLTRFLGPNDFGNYKFLLGIFNFTIIICSFGFFQAGNRALVLNKNSKKAKEYYGAVIFFLFLIFIFMSSILICYAFIDKNIETKGLADLLLYLVPFSWFFLLTRYFEVLFQADNKIYLLAASRFFPVLIFSLLMAVIYFGLKNFQGDKLLLILNAFLGSNILIYLLILYKIKPSFNNFKKRIIEIWNFNKGYGFHVYTGSLFAVGFGQLSIILISYFGMDNSGVGYFALAVTFASPLYLIPNVIATTQYKNFSTKEEIPKKLVLMTIILSISALFVQWLLIPPFVNFFYGTSFNPVIKLNYIISIGVLIHGMADFINRFLGAHGKGKALRNSSFVVGSSLLILNLFFIPIWGETGAAYTKIISSMIYIFTMMWSYNIYFNFTKKLKIIQRR